MAQGSNDLSTLPLSSQVEKSYWRQGRRWNYLEKENVKSRSLKQSKILVPKLCNLSICEKLEQSTRWIKNWGKDFTFDRRLWSAWKIMKNLVGSSWFEIQAKSSLLGAKKIQEIPSFSFQTRRRRFSRTNNDDEASIAAYKLQHIPPAGLKAFLPKRSTKLRRPWPDFDEWPLVGKLQI